MTVKVRRRSDKERRSIKNVWCCQNVEKIVLHHIYLFLTHHIFSVTRLFCNTVIFLVAYQTLPQFQGYRSNSFPRISPERIQEIEPRRMVLSPYFGSDWKKIGSRRTKMLNVQEYSESKGRILIVETNEKEE